MGACSGLNNCLQDCDQFSHSTLLRFKDNESYSTLTGAVVSILHKLFYISLFIYMLYLTAQRSTISSQLETIYTDDPEQSSLDLS